MSSTYDVRRMPRDAFFHDEVPYVDSSGLLSFLGEMAFVEPLLLVGPTGMAKSTAAYAFAQIEGYPVVELSCSEGTRENHLVGSFGMEGDTTFFTLGKATTAIDLANEIALDPDENANGAIFLINEINALDPQIQKSLNPLLDFQRRMDASAIGKMFALAPNARLWVIATMNPAAHGGVHSLNTDLVRRLQPIYLNYPAKEQERAVLEGLKASVISDEYYAIDDSVFNHTVVGGTNFVDQLIELAGDTRQGNLEYSLSTADLHQLCRKVPRFGIERTLVLASYKWEDEQERTFFATKVLSTMGIDIGKLSVLIPPTLASSAAPSRRRA
jgi:MoxR-like ATPase